MEPPPASADDPKRMLYMEALVKSATTGSLSTPLKTVHERLQRIVEASSKVVKGTSSQTKFVEQYRDFCGVALSVLGDLDEVVETLLMPESGLPGAEPEEPMPCITEEAFMTEVATYVTTSGMSVLAHSYLNRIGQQAVQEYMRKRDNSVREMAAAERKQQSKRKRKEETIIVKHSEEMVAAVGALPAATGRHTVDRRAHIALLQQPWLTFRPAWLQVERVSPPPAPNEETGAAPPPPPTPPPELAPDAIYSLSSMDLCMAGSVPQLARMWKQREQYIQLYSKEYHAAVEKGHKRERSRSPSVKKEKLSPRLSPKASPSLPVLKKNCFHEEGQPIDAPEFPDGQGAQHCPDVITPMAVVLSMGRLGVSAIGETLL